MGGPRVLIHLNKMFRYKPSILGYLHLWKREAKHLESKVHGLLGCCPGCRGCPREDLGFATAPAPTLAPSLTGWWYANPYG